MSDTESVSPVHFATDGMNRGKSGLYLQFPCKPKQWTMAEDTTHWSTDRKRVTCPDCMKAMSPPRGFADPSERSVTTVARGNG